jgi:hypothetical protein
MENADEVNEVVSQDGIPLPPRALGGSWESRDRRESWLGWTSPPTVPAQGSWSSRTIGTSSRRPCCVNCRAPGQAPITTQPKRW